MKDLLFLAHRIPFPPNKGDKIRSFHLLRHLSRSWRVHLGAFVDDPADWRHADALRDYCAETCLLPLNPILGKLRCLRGFLTGEPLSVPYYADGAMRAWVEKVVGACPKAGVLVFSSAMAQYLENLDALNRVIDFVDVDSDKWRQYAAGKPWPASWVYAREGERLLDYDRRIAASFDHSLFVSEAEAALFRDLAPESASKISTLENGVDTEYFAPARDYYNPYNTGAEVFVFTGAMDYWANIDAVSWFAHEVFPAIRASHPRSEFFIVGSRPSHAVRELERLSGVIVTGAVDDVRPYLAHAHLAVAPLRIARGVQNKVLEAMAMAKSLLATGAAMEGIDGAEGLDLQVVESAEDWVQVAISTLERQALPLVSSVNRKFVVEQYGWAQSLSRLDACWRENDIGCI